MLLLRYNLTLFRKALSTLSPPVYKVNFVSQVKSNTSDLVPIRWQTFDTALFILVTALSILYNAISIFFNLS